MSKCSVLLTMVSCKHYAELVSRRQDDQLRPLEKIAFAIHHVICMVCRRFSRQVQAMDKAAARLGRIDSPAGSDHAENEVCLDPACRERIAGVLKQELEKSSFVKD